MEEAVVNAVLHRSYEQPPEPIKVSLYPDRMEITSYPGPMPGLELRHLQPGARCPSIAQRNRRVGEFLKELRLAEMRNTGIAKIYRKMSENGSPQPVFDFDQERSYFRVILPTHPKYVVLHALRESATLWATGERERAVARLEEAQRNAPNSGVLVAQQIEYLAATSDLARAKTLLTKLEQNPRADDRHLAYIALARAHLDRGESEEASRLLDNAPRPSRATETLELAILYRRSGQFKKAHQLFVAAYPQLMDDPKAVHEFAQTKAQLAAQMRPSPKHPQEYQARRKLTREAVELLHRAIQLADNPLRAAWAWVNLARQLYFLHAPASEIREAYQRALALAPEEERFRKWFEEWESGRGAPPAPDGDHAQSR